MTQSLPEIRAFTIDEFIKWYPENTNICLSPIKRNQSGEYLVPTTWPSLK